MPQEVGKFSKYFLFSTNIFFWLAAFGLFCVGLWAWSEKGFFDSISSMSSLPIDPIWIIMGVAMAMFFFSFFGCVGSLRENIFLLTVYSIGLALILIAEFVLGLLVFIYEDFFHQKFANFVNSTIKEYREDSDLQNVIDFTQEYLQCCGGEAGPSDWDNNIYFNCDSKILVNNFEYIPVEACGVPYSCCIRSLFTVEDALVDSQCGYEVRKVASALDYIDKIYTSGCISSFEDWMKQNIETVGGVFISVALLHVIPIIFARNLISDIEAIRAKWKTASQKKSRETRATLKPSHKRASSTPTVQKHGQLVAPKSKSVSGVTKISI